LATLSTVLAPLKSLEASFSSQHSWDSPFRALLLFRDPKPLSKSCFRPCTFLQNLSALYRCSNGLSPRKKPCPYLLPRGLVRVGTACSLELSGLSGSLVSTAKNKASPSILAPLVLASTILTNYRFGTPGVRVSRASASPSEKGAGLSGLSHQLVLSLCLKR